MFGSLTGPMHKSKVLKQPLELIESEYESIITEIDHHINEANTKIEDANKKYKGQEEKLKEEKIKIFDNLTKKRRSLLDRINSSSTRRQFDKITFFLSLIVIQYKSFALGKYPDNGVYILNLALMIFLLIWRNVTFRIDKTHYYMFEFCYFANVVLYIFIFFFPENKTLYLASFAFC